MAIERPNESGWGNAGEAPLTAVRNRGYGGNQPAVKQWENWFWYTMGKWTTWFKERFSTSGSNNEHLTMNAPVDEGGDLSLLAGDSFGLSNTNGGALRLAAGNSRGSGYSKTELYAAVAGASGSTERTPSIFVTADGQNGYLQLHRTATENSPARTQRISGVSAAFFGTSTSVNGPYGHVYGDTSGDEFCLAPVFPQGGTLTAIRAWTRCQATSTTASLYLYRKSVTDEVDGTVTTVASHTGVTITNTSGYHMAATGLSHTIDTVNYYYWVRVTLDATSGGFALGFVEFDIQPATLNLTGRS